MSMYLFVNFNISNSLTYMIFCYKKIEYSEWFVIVLEIIYIGDDLENKIETPTRIKFLVKSVNFE